MQTWAAGNGHEIIARAPAHARPPPEGGSLNGSLTITAPHDITRTYKLEARALRTRTEVPACETERSALLVSGLENSHHRLEGKTMTASRNGERLKRKH